MRGASGRRKVTIENQLARCVSSLGKGQAYDDICKLLLSNRQILAWIMKYCVEEFCSSSIKEIAENYIEEISTVKEMVHRDEKGEFILGRSNEDVSATEGRVYFDIRFTAVAPVKEKWIRLFVNVEAQNDFYPGYPLVKRGIYYGSRMISAQHGTVFSDSHYEKIQKVYSIWICTNPPKYRRNTILRYSIQEEPLVGNAKEDKAAYDLLTVVMVCLDKQEEENDTGLLKMLEVLLSNRRTPTEKKQILQEEFGIVLTKEMKEEVREMCNLSQGVYNEGWNEAVLTAISNMQESTGWSTEKCMEILKVPQEQQEIFKTKLKALVNA